MKVGEVLHGFELKYSKPLAEINAVLHRFTYVKNGADTVWLERNDDNKSFMITFRTVPTDETGVFHILEHSVLNGSEKYPLREPFVELIKSSLATFLNAMTAPDMTMYPVSSRNDKDFLNLIDVYMDAVLHPVSLKDPHSFRQEGWHYELDDPDGELSVNGVVFNEMKGAYTSSDELIRDNLNRLLFPDTCYGQDSGGNPEHIPELTYEQYKASHRRYYHPSNSYIFLDGKVDLDAVLEKLDGFLRDYDKIDPDSEIALQKPVAPAEVTEYYPIGAEDDDENKALLGKGWVYGTAGEIKKNMAVGVLNDALAGSNESPLCKALLDLNLCEDVSLERSMGGLQSGVKLILKNCDPSKKDLI
ncbi:MAG: insulinase family protein, partial [Clostridia bacterium]|nr:insulinase family protein [Clostridia bacterium]